MTVKYEEKSRRHSSLIHPHYAAMCEAMDESVGLILDTLDHLNLADNTMVVFFSDNGGVQHCFYDERGEQITDTSPLRGEKGGVYEGGIRVPMIVRWPGHVAPGSICDTPVISTDFLPTFSEGHFIMPSRLAGFGYLDAVREVFPGGGEHVDLIPNPPQRKRFNLRYPRPVLDD